MSAAEKHIEEMRRAAAADPETMIGICEGGFPITSGSCEFCGATWENKCRRANRNLGGGQTARDASGG